MPTDAATPPDSPSGRPIDADPGLALAAVAEIFLTAEGMDDPYPAYATLHRHGPALDTPTGVILAGFADCQAVLRDNRFGKDSDPERQTPGGDDTDPEVVAFRRERAEANRDGPISMLMANPPDHTRIRGLVSRVFTPRRVESMRAHMVELADECLDDLAERRTADALEVIGFPFPVSVIGELVGVPRADWPRFRQLATTAALSLEPSARIDDLRAAAAATSEMWTYFVDLVEHKRRRPADDLLSGMIEATADGDRLTEDEAIVQAMLMFAAGFETTTNLIGNGLAALLTHPEQFDRLWSEPDLVPAAVEEMLRWDSPVQLDGRTAFEDLTAAGIDISAGTRVVTLLGAANRDPHQFTEPDRFDVARAEGPPLSFASGIHYCLGANLARAEGQVVFSGLRHRFSSIELDGPLVHRRRITLRGYEAVPVRVTPR